MASIARRIFKRSSVADMSAVTLEDDPAVLQFFASLEKEDGDDPSAMAAVPPPRDLSLGDLLQQGQFAETLVLTKRPPLVDDKEPLALKRLSSAVKTSGDAAALTKAARALVNDALMLRKLRHANIVSLRGMTRDAYGTCVVGHDWEAFGLLVTRCDDTLADRILQWRRQGQEPEEDLIPRKCNYALQIARALQYCHSQGVLFRDLKPLNVGFHSQDRHLVQLMDFGLARSLPQQQRPEESSTAADTPHQLTMAGTRRYLDPHVLTTGGHYTFKSDVYSWACVLWEALAERKPYAGYTAAQHQLYVCQQEERPDLTTCYLPEELEAILRQAWSPSLPKRFSMTQVCDQLQTFLMHLDWHYYQQEEDDFLFDIQLPTLVHPQDEDEISELGHADDLQLDDIDLELAATQSVTNHDWYLAQDHLLQEDRPHDHDHDDDDGDDSVQVRHASAKSLDTADGGVQPPKNLPTVHDKKPRKVISSAA